MILVDIYHAGVDQSQAARDILVKEAELSSF